MRETQKFEDFIKNTTFDSQIFDLSDIFARGVYPESKNNLLEQIKEDYKKEEQYNDLKGTVDAIFDIVKELPGEHQQIINNINTVNKNIMTYKEILTTIRRQPHTVLRVGLFGLLSFCVFSIVIGKIIDKIILAPDFALAIILITVTLLTMIQVDIHQIKQAEKK